MHAPAPTRILYVITDLELGGVPLHLQRLAKAIRARGLHVTVVSLAPPGPVGAQLTADGIRVLSCDGRGGWDIRVISRLAAIIRREKPDLIHGLLFHANLASRLAAPSVGFPPRRLLCEIQTAEVERRWHLWVDRFTHHDCGCFIGNSPSVIDHLAERAGIPRHKLHLVPGGIDPEPLQAATPIDRSALGVPSHGGLILWVGRFDPVKGLNFLLDAFHQLALRHDAHLVLAGGPTTAPTCHAIRSRATSLALHDRVHVLGPRSDVPSLLKSADLFVFPSRTEGLPNALLEAMAAARPIVTTDVPGCRDLIQHEKNGLLVPYGDTNALTAAMNRVLADPELAHRLAAAAASEVTRRWSHRATVEACLAIYARTLGQKLPPGLRSPAESEIKT